MILNKQPQNTQFIFPDERFLAESNIPEIISADLVTRP